MLSYITRRVFASRSICWFRKVPYRVYKKLLLIICFAYLVKTIITALQLPTLYDHYTTGGLKEGLSANQPYFTLNHKYINIYSGSMHYFRIPKQYWRDRLRKLKAAGLNTVETYVPWNLHEPVLGQFDFGDGGSDFEDFLDVKRFLEIAKEEDLLAIVRPGPYICAEWELGGLPSWLLRNKKIKLRSSDFTYMRHVTRYFNKLLPILEPLQFTKGGPIIAFQIENEYASTREQDKHYLEDLRNLMLENGIVELLVSSDGPYFGDRGTLPGELLQTINFYENPEKHLANLGKRQPNKPVMVMEFWYGWFDHWSEMHHKVSVSSYYEQILKYNASVNLYMFHGGTSFGFMNGANSKNDDVYNSGYSPDTTSYDYDAPLTENGNYTEKYYDIKKLLNEYNPIKLRIPDMPPVKQTVKYDPISIERQINFHDLIRSAPEVFEYENVVSMEQLPMNNASGQSFGYIVYRKENIDIPYLANLMISGHICDTVMLMVNGILISKPLTTSSDLNGFGYWRIHNSTITCSLQYLTDATIDLVVENWGRVNFGSIDQISNQFKGLWQGDVYLNNEQIRNWKIIPLEFKKFWTNSLSGWQPFDLSTIGPTLYEATLEVDTPQDTFVDMHEWTKGIVIINGFVLGRYAKIGPQQSLYLPAPLIKEGKNKFVIFEHFMPASEVIFSHKQLFKTIR